MANTNTVNITSILKHRKPRAEKAVASGGFGPTAKVARFWQGHCRENGVDAASIRVEQERCVVVRVPGAREGTRAQA